MQGYSLMTDMIARQGLIEVYPHPALVELALRNPTAIQSIEGPQLLATCHARRAASSLPSTMD
jgi:predicted RNase H-like nuclease